jgi:hypothetical protein
MPKFSYRFKTLRFVEIVKLLYNAKTWSNSFVAVSGDIFVFTGPNFFVYLLFLASLCVLLSAVPCNLLTFTLRYLHIPVLSCTVGLPTSEHARGGLLQIRLHILIPGITVSDTVCQFELIITFIHSGAAMARLVWRRNKVWMAGIQFPEGARYFSSPQRPDRLSGPPSLLPEACSGWLRAGWPRGRSSSPDRVKNFFFSTSSRQVLGSTQPPIQWVPWDLCPGVKLPGREADHSPPASAKVKQMWSVYPLSHTPSRRRA